MDEFYTRLFVNIAMPEGMLLGRVAEILDGRIERRSVAATGVAADIRANEDASAADVERDPADFLHYPYTVELVAEGLDLEAYLERVAEVMRALRADGGDVVAACDWEDRLPGKGTLIGRPG
jgi:hypothetical protein